MKPNVFEITESTAGTVLASLRAHVPGTSWSAARRLLAQCRIGVNGIVCIDEARRLAVGDRLEIRHMPFSAPPSDDDVIILHLDPSVVVVSKPSGMLSVRHPGDREWRDAKKMRQPSLEECVQRLIARREKSHTEKPLLPVHRIDRETSGVLMFARTENAQKDLIRLFAAHDIHRRYLCVVPGAPAAQRLESHQIRDRGDGLRGTMQADSDEGLHMVTRIRPLRSFGEWTELECLLETGRTNQIRIQLAEIGHPLCGDVKYRGPFGQPAIPDRSHAPRLALHAAELGFRHPVSGAALEFQRPWPSDILRWLDQLRRSGQKNG